MADNVKGGVRKILKEKSVKVIFSTLAIFMLVTSSFVYAGSGDDFQWRDVREACKGKHESDACLEQREKARVYCKKHADKKRCHKMKALKECKHNPDSEQCKEHKEKFKAYCEENPGAKKCVRARIHKICKDDPKSNECLAAKEQAHTKFCENHPDHERCS